MVLPKIDLFFLIILLGSLVISTWSNADNTVLPDSASRISSSEIVSKIKASKTLNIGVSFAIPPWVIAENNSGIELDILKETLAPSGYELKPNYLPFALSYSLFEAGKLDIVLNAKKPALKSGFLSDPVVTFQNVAVSLQEKGFPEDISLPFLIDKSVIAFQKASILLGEEFAEMTKKNPMYQEIANQSQQINLLMISNIDFIVMDKSIFDYYLQKAKSNPNLIRAKSKLDQAVRFHYLFKPNKYRFAFKSEKVRDDFNAGLNKIKNKGIYDEIFSRYSN
jgi:polar amino acid transport system substrate-binding protein